MKTSRRMQRLARYRAKLQTIPLTSLMDVFTILVFFLLVNSGTSELLQTPRDMVLPESVVEVKPRETVVIYVNQDEVIVQGEPVVRIADIIAAGGGDIVPIMMRLAELQDRVIGVRTQTVSQSKEVTILADILGGGDGLSRVGYRGRLPRNDRIRQGFPPSINEKPGPSLIRASTINFSAPGSYIT